MMDLRTFKEKIERDLKHADERSMHFNAIAKNPNTTEENRIEAEKDVEYFEGHVIALEMVKYYIKMYLED